MKKISLGLLLTPYLFALMATSFVGCGPAETVYPSGQFTEEQKTQAQQEYQSVEDEESKGNNKKKTAKR